MLKSKPRASMDTKSSQRVRTGVNGNCKQPDNRKKSYQNFAKVKESLERNRMNKTAIFLTIFTADTSRPVKSISRKEVLKVPARKNTIAFFFVAKML